MPNASAPYRALEWQHYEADHRVELAAILDSPECGGRSLARTEQEQGLPVDHRSFRDRLVFSVGFALTRSRALSRRLVTEHAPDDARQMLAERVIQHLEQSGFEIDEDTQALRAKPVASLHRTPGE